jgi:hypothetical protein
MRKDSQECLINDHERPLVVQVHAARQSVCPKTERPLMVSSFRLKIQIKNKKREGTRSPSDKSSRPPPPSQCHDAAAYLVPELLNALKTTSPRQFCASDSYCGLKQESVEVWRCGIRKHLGWVRLSNPVLNGLECFFTSQAGQFNQPVLRGPVCSMCTFVVNRLKEYLNDTSVQDSIISTAKKACSILPQEFLNSCFEFVDSYGASSYCVILLAASNAVCIVRVR